MTAWGDLLAPYRHCHRATDWEAGCLCFDFAMVQGSSGLDLADTSFIGLSSFAKKVNKNDAIIFPRF